ncbi:predicted protein [Plenodomus lingam JN3]|uniref:Predicted protein n=1 Tax=Leptosphaeria maculans (strain JN3 / isolate v23.1.3 / race Av1-4-5-6-7-8) TaxID=985895 RepID=E5A1Y0_LEPMJ|nr:predicted protein [Plenodomus lingam JN3]CBX97697.1 predicted protein [Plenodomus lingam JN3]
MADHGWLIRSSHLTPIHSRYYVPWATYKSEHSTRTIFSALNLLAAKADRPFSSQRDTLRVLQTTAMSCMWSTPRLPSPNRRPPTPPSGFDAGVLVVSKSMEIPEKLFLAMAPTQMAIGFGSCFGQTLTILGTCVEDKWTNRV